MQRQGRVNPRTKWLVPVLGLCLGLIVLYLAAWRHSFDGMVAWRSEDAWDRSLPQALYGLPLLLVGAFLFLASAFRLLHLFLLKERADAFLQKNEIRIVAILILAFLVLIVLNSRHRFFDGDEFEHVHSAWYVESGKVPFRDFFENHNPLLWYTMLPVLKLFGHTVKAVLALRGLMLALSLGSALLVYRLASQITVSREIGIVSLLLLLSTVLFSQKGIEIRPDVPQVFFGLMSISFLIDFFRRSEAKKIALSGLSASLSFLYLQKSLFLLAAFAVVFAYGRLRKRIEWRHIAAFGLSALLPLLAFLGFLLATRSLGDYWATNWLAHAHKSRFYGDLLSLSGVLAENTVLIVYLIAAVPFAWKHKKSPEALKLVTFLGLFLLLAGLSYKASYSQHFLLPASLLCIPIAFYLRERFVELKKTGGEKLATLLLIVCIPFLVLTVTLLITNQKQLERIDFVLRNTRETDLVYDGRSRFNLFRPDLHYFWYATRTVDQTGQELFGEENRSADFDACELIKAKKPKFISEYRLDMEACGLSSLYRETGFEGLLMRAKSAARPVGPADL